MTTRLVRQPRVPSPPVLEQHFAHLFERPNVTGCFVGKRRKDGEETDELAVVCCVSKKMKSGLPKADRLPRSISWARTSQHRARLRVDVIEIGPSGRQGVAGPGDRVTYKKAPATVGVAIHHPCYGQVVTTAGHLFTPETDVGEVNYPLNDLPVVRCTNSTTNRGFRGRLLRHVMSETADYALVLPDDSHPARNLYNDRLPFTATRTLTDSDLGTILFAATSERLQRTKLRGYRATMPVGECEFKDALLTDRVTTGGDSGCALVTPEGFVCGLLVGFSGPFSVFMSVRVPLDRERATLAQGEFNAF